MSWEEETGEGLCMCLDSEGKVMPECSSNKAKCLNDYSGNQQSKIVTFRVFENTALTTANVCFLLSGF